MKKEFKISIKEAQRLTRKIEDKAHGYIHVKAVSKFASEIVKEYKEANKDVVQIAVWWHDVGRIYDDKNHNKISADMAYKFLKGLNIDENICQNVCKAIINHYWLMIPETIEGKIVRDADKLDFISIKRWKIWIKNNNFQYINEVTGALSNFREKFFDLEISKKIFDKRIKKFIKFIKSVKNKNFKETKNRILSYNL